MRNEKEEVKRNQQVIQERVHILEKNHEAFRETGKQIQTEFELMMEEKYGEIKNQIYQSTNAWKAEAQYILKTQGELTGKLRHMPHPGTICRRKPTYNNLKARQHLLGIPRNQLIQIFAFVLKGPALSWYHSNRD